MTDEHPQSDRQQLVQTRFDAHGLGPVGDWIQQQRDAGKSWAAISFRIRELVALDVSYETLRRWSARDQPGQEAPGVDAE